MELDTYKERGTNQGLLAEPINLLSNIAFFAATLLTMPFCRSWVDGILSTGISIVGIASSLYHARPCRMTLLGDTLSIVVWTIFYVFVWAHFMMGFQPLVTAGVMITFFTLNILFDWKFGKAMNGSADYIPVIILLLFCGSCVWYKSGHPHLVIAGILAAGALVFRVVDRDVHLPTGTHFIWHILNGFMMALLTLFVSIYVMVEGAT